MTTSPAGLYGNFGQSNYSAAKMALHGLCKTLSIEGKKNNIFVNTIAPLALTRMTEDIMPGADLKPVHVAPFVVYLCHETCNETGSLVEAAGGYACKTRLQRSRGVQLRKFIGDNPSVEAVANSWESLTDFTFSSVVENNNASANVIMESLQDLPEHPLSPNASDLEIMQSHKIPEMPFMYTSWDVIRYALSIGAGLPDDGAFIYEGHSDFCVIPSFAACMGQVRKEFPSTLILSNQLIISSFSWNCSLYLKPDDIYSRHETCLFIIIFSISYACYVKKSFERKRAKNNLKREITDWLK